MFLLEPFGVLGTAENQAEIPRPRGSTLAVLVMSSGGKIPATNRSWVYKSLQLHSKGKIATNFNSNYEEMLEMS